MPTFLFFLYSETPSIEKLLSKDWKDKHDDKHHHLVNNNTVIDITVANGDVNVSDLKGGVATVTVPYTPADDEDTDDLVVWHINDQGKLEAYRCYYKDGNVSFENAKRMSEAGANLFVAGSSSVFAKDATISENLNKLREML